MWGYIFGFFRLWFSSIFIGTKTIIGAILDRLSTIQTVSNAYGRSDQNRWTIRTRSVCASWSAPWIFIQPIRWKYFKSERAASGVLVETGPSNLWSNIMCDRSVCQNTPSTGATTWTRPVFRSVNMCRFEVSRTQHTVVATHSLQICRVLKNSDTTMNLDFT